MDISPEWNKLNENSIKNEKSEFAVVYAVVQYSISEHKRSWTCRTSIAFVTAQHGSCYIGSVCADNSFVVIVQVVQRSGGGVAIDTAAVCSLIIIIIITVIIIVVVVVVSVLVARRLMRHAAAAAAARRLLVANESDDVGQRKHEPTFTARQQIAAFDRASCSPQKRNVTIFVTATVFNHSNKVNLWLFMPHRNFRLDPFNILTFC